MSRYHNAESSEVPFRVDESRDLKLNIKTLLAIIAAVVLAAWSWFSLKSDVTSQGKDISTMQSDLKDIKQDLRSFLRRGTKPTPSDPSNP